MVRRCVSGKINGLVMLLFGNSIRHYIALYVTKGILSPKFWRILQTFRNDLSGQRLVAWNALLQRLANIQLQDDHDEFRWNLYENGKFSVASMYNAYLMCQSIKLAMISFGS
jgi:hypothetical protein